jgi:hypothetical protein
MIYFTLMKREIMRKIFLFIFMLAILTSCGFYETRRQGVVRPTFEMQKTYVLIRYPVEIIPIYYVWTQKYTAFFEQRDLKDSVVFKATKDFSFSENKFTIEEAKTKKKYYLKEEENKMDKDRILYSITNKDGLNIKISAKFKDDFLVYEFIFNEDVYQFEGKINKFAEAIYSFDFVLKKNDIEIAHIFKEYTYFKNETEVIINKKVSKFDDLAYISLGVFVDQILRENGYNFR